MPSVKNVGTFIELLAKANPELVISNLPVIHNQIDSPAHQIRFVWELSLSKLKHNLQHSIFRSSVITAMSHLVAYVHTTCATTLNSSTDTSDENCKTLDDGQVSEVHNQINESNEEDEDFEMNEKSNKADNPDMNIKNTNQLGRVRDSVLNIMVERTHDKNYYTRVAVLKAWSFLLEASAIPVRHINTVCEIAVDRLSDKTAIVRKNAISLLVSLLDNNPFGSDLSIDYFIQMQTAANQSLENRIKDIKSTVGFNHDGSITRNSFDGKNSKNLSLILEEDDEDVEDDSHEDVKLKEQMKADEYNQFLQSEDVKGDSEILEIKIKLEYLNNALHLTATIGRALNIIQDMLFSKTVSDVIESLQFITRAVNFNINGSTPYLQK
jgi:hypothetical protein